MGSWSWDYENKELVYQTVEPEDELRDEEDEFFDSENIEEETARKPEIVYRKEIECVTLQDIKQVVLQFAAREGPFPKGFEDFVNLPIVDELLMWLFRYFYYYFEIWCRKLCVVNEQTIDNDLGREYTMSELQNFLDISLRCASQKYCNILMGVGCEEYHHLGCGKFFLSSTISDRNLFEKFYSFVTEAVWICLSRRDREVVVYEVNRLFRSNDFSTYKGKEIFTIEDKASSFHQKGVATEQWQKSPLLMSVVSTFKPIPPSIIYLPRSQDELGESEKKEVHEICIPESFTEATILVEQQIPLVGILGKKRNDFDSDLELLDVQ